ncbi:MAG: hypothetical protein HUJ11_00185 [Arenibacter algicola]|nr:hypothetical protein [Arenibacter algicola]
MKGAKDNETNIDYIDEDGDNEDELKEGHTYWIQSDGSNWQLISKFD